jgi:superfamily II DNA or RNA helicase
MKLDPKRLARQKIGLSKWKTNNYIGTLQYGTGVGKTICALIGIKHLKEQFPQLNTIVSVPTDNLRTQWKTLIEQWGLDNVYVDTVHSLVGKSHDCDLFILDEIHSYTGGEVFSTLFDCVKRKFTLGLTASPRDKSEDLEILNKNAPVIDIITIADALKLGFISPFKIYNLELEFNEVDKIIYDKLNKDFHKYFSTFGHDFDTAMGCLSNSRLREQVAREMGMELKTVNAHTFQFNKIMQQRKNYIHNADVSFQTAVQLCNHFEDKKIITFSETTDMVDRLTSATKNSVAYHSNLKTKKINGKKYGAKRLKERALKSFKENRYRILHSARALNMGQDVPHIDMSIKIAFNSTIIDSVQRLGRTLRLMENKEALEINLYIKGTQSEKWLRKSQVGLPNIQWITSIDEIAV